MFASTFPLRHPCCDVALEQHAGESRGKSVGKTESIVQVCLERAAEMNFQYERRAAELG